MTQLALPWRLQDSVERYFEERQSSVQVLQEDVPEYYRDEAAGRASTVAVQLGLCDLSCHACTFSYSAGHAVLAATAMGASLPDHYTSPSLTPPYITFCHCSHASLLRQLPLLYNASAVMPLQLR